MSVGFIIFLCYWVSVWVSTWFKYAAYAAFDMFCITIEPIFLLLCVMPGCFVQTW